MRFGWCAGLVLAVAVTGWSSGAMASTDEDARAIEAEALKSMRAGDTEAAYLLALEADALDSSIVSRWLIAIGADGLGRRAEALAAYRSLVAEGSLPAVRAAEARRRITALEKADTPKKADTPEKPLKKKKPAAPPREEPDDASKPAPKAEPSAAPPSLPALGPAPGSLPSAEAPAPGATAIGLRVGGFLALAGTFGAGGALVYYGLSSRTAASSNARYVNGVYAQRLIPVTAGLGAAALVMLPLGYLVEWDDAETADAKAAKETHVSFAPGPGEVGLGLDVRF